MRTLFYCFMIALLAPFTSAYAQRGPAADAWELLGEQSVGFRVDVRHLAPTQIGKKVTSKVALREINGRRCIFDVEVHSEDGVKIGEGMHERAIIDIARFTKANG